MIGRIVEIEGAGRYLAVDRGFLVVRAESEEIGRVPLDDIAGLICNAHGLSYSNNLLLALADRGCPVVLCGHNHLPVAILWPVATHHRQAARMDAQLAAPRPVRKRLWKQIVQAKVGMQAEVLRLCDRPSAPLNRLVGRVRAGDPSNVEGQAARVYWKLLMGQGFNRDADGDGVNGLLNYGYAIIRSTVARHLMATGLHPGLPLHHANEGNPMRLVDDLMEPFRPIADAWVWRLLQQGTTTVGAQSKGALALLPVRTMLTEAGRSPLTLVVQRLCLSLAQVYEGQRTVLDLPAPDGSTLAAIWDDGNGDQQEPTEQEKA